MAPPSNMSGYYSNLSGKRKALCIGINCASRSRSLARRLAVRGRSCRSSSAELEWCHADTGTSSQLNGCHNDARNISKFLCERFNYKEEDIVMLLDTPGAAPMSVPTRDNIVRPSSRSRGPSASLGRS